METAPRVARWRCSAGSRPAWAPIPYAPLTWLDDAARGARDEQVASVQLPQHQLEAARLLRDADPPLPSPSHPLPALTWLDDAARGARDQQVASVQLPQHQLEAAQRLRDADRLQAHEVVALPLVERMLFLLQHDDHVARLHARLKHAARGG